MPKFGEKSTHGNNRRITKQQQDFLDNYVHKDMTQTGAAREAGYKNPTVAAVRLLRNPVVQERLDEMRLEAKNKFGVTIDKSVRDLKQLRDEAWQNGRFGDAIRAEELRLKATGLLVSKSHVLHEDVNVMTKEEILDKLQQFSRMANNRMKDITPKEKDKLQIVDDN